METGKRGETLTLFHRWVREPRETKVMANADGKEECSTLGYLGIFTGKIGYRIKVRREVASTREQILRSV